MWKRVARSQVTGDGGTKEWHDIVVSEMMTGVWRKEGSREIV